MLTVKMLKPYYVKVDREYLRLILGYQYFTVFMNDAEYEFIPTESKEIKINRRTRKIENIEDKFAFQKGTDVIYITMNELIYLPDFMIHLYDIAKPYYTRDIDAKQQEENDMNEAIIDELERLNVKRMIDKALDERDEESFYTLLKML
ncbi:MAG TPA: IDEAL domain-containing protein [Virgibacillus sp.]|nr:IDEAL domain-containing protein [Virgibacillus sp.]